MIDKDLSKNLKPGGSFFEDTFRKDTLNGLKMKELTFIGCLFPAKFGWDNLTIQNSSFTNCRFSKNAWSKSKVENCQFVNCTFTENTFQNIEFQSCTLVNCEFKKAQLENCCFSQSMIDSAKFIDECKWSGTIEGTKLLRSTWPSTTLSWQAVPESHFYQVDFAGKTFPWAQAQGTVFDDCFMGECRLQKHSFANLNFSRCQFDLLDLTDASPANVDFIESQFKKVLAQRLNAEYLQMGRTTIVEGNFDHMILTGASIFMESNLTNVSFKQAKMGMAVLEKANIADRNFQDAEFLGCNLSDAKLKQVSFTDAKMKNLHLSDTLMDEVTGLN